MSARARKAAEKRESARLFPPRYWDKPEPTEDEKREAERVRLLRAAQNLRDLAAQGMRTRAYTRQAAEMEAMAAAL